MSYIGIDHISYTVSDLDRSIAFYTLLLGDEPFLRKEWDEEYVGRLCGYDRVRLEAAFWNLPHGPTLELLEFSIPEGVRLPFEMYQAGNSHLGLVCEDMRAEFERLRAAGVEFQSENVIEIPWGPYKGGLACFARDPDGIFIELFQLPPGGPALAQRTRPVHFSGLDHIGFSVTSLDRSIAFFTLLLGEGPFLRKVWDVPYVGDIVGYPGLELDAAFWWLPGGAVLELLEYVEPPPSRVDMETYNAGNAHLCLVTEDMEADFARLRGYAEFRSPAPVEIPWGPYEGGRACYLRDPDGISIELIELPPGGPRFAGGPGSVG